MTSFRPTALLTLIYVAAYLGFGQLHFPLQKDELHFWPTALFFSRSLVPTAEQLRTYNDLSTPVPFVIFGALENLFHQGYWLARFTNFLVSFLCALTVLFAGKKVTRAALLCTAGLLLFPYFVGVSTHVYTDTIASAFALAGVAFFLEGKALIAALFFAGAVSSRQYAVVFPAGLLCFSFLHGQTRLNTIAPLVLPLLALFGWFLFWGGPANSLALSTQIVATSGWASLLPHNVGYFLACVGLYFCLPELLFFPESRKEFQGQLAQRKRTALIVVAVLLYFSLFPPLGNLEPYPFKEMGYLDKTLRLFLGDFLRVVVLGGLAFLTVLRFFRDQLAAYFVGLNAALMAKAHIAWDKYALSLLLVLWFLKAKPINPEGYPAKAHL